MVTPGLIKINLIVSLSGRYRLIPYQAETKTSEANFSLTGSSPWSPWGSLKNSSKSIKIGWSKHSRLAGWQKPLGAVGTPSHGGPGGQAGPPLGLRQRGGPAEFLSESRPDRTSS